MEAQVVQRVTEIISTLIATPQQITVRLLTKVCYEWFWDECSKDDRIEVKVSPSEVWRNGIAAIKCRTSSLLNVSAIIYSKGIELESTQDDVSLGLAQRVQTVA